MNFLMFIMNKGLNTKSQKIHIFEFIISNDYPQKPKHPIETITN